MPLDSSQSQIEVNFELFFSILCHYQCLLYDHCINKFKQSYGLMEFWISKEDLYMEENFNLLCSHLDLFCWFHVLSVAWKQYLGRLQILSIHFLIGIICLCLWCAWHFNWWSGPHVRPPIDQWKCQAATLKVS